MFRIEGFANVFKKGFWIYTGFRILDLYCLRGDGASQMLYCLKTFVAESPRAVYRRKSQTPNVCGTISQNMRQLKVVEAAQERYLNHPSTIPREFPLQAECRTKLQGLGTLGVLYRGRNKYQYYFGGVLIRIIVYWAPKPCSNY